MPSPIARAAAGTAWSRGWTSTSRAAKSWGLSGNRAAASPPWRCSFWAIAIRRCGPTPAASRSREPTSCASTGPRSTGCAAKPSASCRRIPRRRSIPACGWARRSTRVLQPTGRAMPRPGGCASPNSSGWSASRTRRTSRSVTRISCRAASSSASASPWRSPATRSSWFSTSPRRGSTSRPRSRSSNFSSTCGRACRCRCSMSRMISLCCRNSRTVSA